MAIFNADEMRKLIAEAEAFSIREVDTKVMDRVMTQLEAAVRESARNGVKFTRVVMNTDDVFDSNDNVNSFRSAAVEAQNRLRELGFETTVLIPRTMNRKFDIDFCITVP